MAKMTDIHRELNKLRNMWSDLPNAKHIDRIIDSLKTNHKLWVNIANPKNAAWNEVYNATWSVVWDADRGTAWDAAWNEVYNATWSVVWDADRGTAWDAAWKATSYATRWAASDTASDTASGAVYNSVIGALTALVAYDDCAYMLDSDPGELAIIAKFGDPRAILLLPMCKVLNKEREFV